MTLSLIILNLFINVNVTNIFKIILICLTYALVGGFIYIFISYKMGLINEILGNDFIEKIRFKRKKAIFVF